MSSTATALLRLLPPESAHRLAIRALRAGLVPGSARADPPSLGTRVFGLDFPNPVGIAAGFDKDAEAFAPLLARGAGFVEVGTITPQPQAGNRKPRIFRLPADRAVINRLGFNNRGMVAALMRLSGRDRARGVVGANIGRNKDSDDALADYRACFETLAPHADYVTVNVSSPNTPGLRDLQAKAELEKLIDVLHAARSALDLSLPVLVKIAPDLDDAACADIGAVASERNLDGLIVSNTTVARPDALTGSARNEAGGLSGQPLFKPSTDILRRIYRLTDGRIPLIGVGGIASADDAYEKIRAGASLIQLYTGLTYHGLGLLDDIKTGLAQRLTDDGFKSVADAVGADA